MIADVAARRTKRHVIRRAAALLDRHMAFVDALHHQRARHLLEELGVEPAGQAADRKSTRLNSSHSQISYAVFCLKKKKKKKIHRNNEDTRKQADTPSNKN